MSTNKSKLSLNYYSKVRAGAKDGKTRVGERDSTPKYPKKSSNELAPEEHLPAEVYQASIDSNQFDFYRETFNQENLDYINSLLVNKEKGMENPAFGSGHHRKSKSTTFTTPSHGLNNAQRSQNEALKLEKHSSRESDTVVDNKGSPLSISQISDKNSDKDGRRTKGMLENELSEKEDAWKKDLDKSGEKKKLFDDFFKSQGSEIANNMKRSTDSCCTVPVLQDISNNRGTVVMSTDDLKKNNAPVFSSKGGDFINCINGFLDYFTQVPDEANADTFIKDQEKWLMKSNRKSGKLTGMALKENEKENDILKMELEKSHLKIKKLTASNKTLLSELNKYKIRDDERKNIVNYQQQELQKLRSLVKNLQFKLNYTQEALAREKIECENSIIALKKVLNNKMNSNTFKDKIKKAIGVEIPVGGEKPGREKKGFPADQYEFLFNNSSVQDSQNTYMDVLESYDNMHLNKSVEDSGLKSEIPLDEEFYDHVLKYNKNFDYGKSHIQQPVGMYDLKKKRNSMHSKEGKNIKHQGLVEQLRICAENYMSLGQTTTMRMMAFRRE